MRRVTVTIPSFAGAELGEGVEDPASRVVLPAGEAHHVRDVLRLKQGDPLWIADGRGRLWYGIVASVSATSVSVALSGRSEDAAPPAPVTIAVALIKKGFDEIVRKAVEVGISELVPLVTVRTVKGLTGKDERWCRIAEQAQKQAGRAHALRIRSVVPLADYVAGKQRAGLFIADVEAVEPLSVAARGAVPPFEIAIGPEGGLTADERRFMIAAGFKPVSLGDAVLRTETAAIAAGVLLGEVVRTRAFDGTYSVNP